MQSIPDKTSLYYIIIINEIGEKSKHIGGNHTINKVYAIIQNRPTGSNHIFSGFWSSDLMFFKLVYN